MIPRSHIGKGISGAVRYALGEGRDRETGRPRTEPKGERSRVEWIGGTGFGFAIENRDDADLARKVMEFMALNQASKTKLCEKDCLHLSLGWRQGEQPTREQMEEAARGALAALGMANARAIFVCHNDEQYPHLHIVASKINPETGRAYDLKGDHLKLSTWAEKYERDFSGGIICTRREETNQLRSAIDRRDAAAVLALMVQQRATFTAKDLDRALGKQIRQPLQRAQFGNDVLALGEVVRLTDPARPETVRYTTRTVLEAEGQVLRAANALVSADRHAVSADIRRAVLNSPKFAGISREQAAAFLHSIGSEGLALIDGQAGTGKSYTVSAIRQAYERAGFHVIGLGPTNAVAADMLDSGFRRASTIHSELFRLKNGRTAWDGRTAIILDEAAMIDTQLMAQVTQRAAEAGAKLVMLGDDRQLSSIDRGGMFGVLKDRHGAAELSQVRRQHKNDDKRAAELMAEGNFATALGMYDTKGAIHWERSQDDAREALIEQWAKDTRADPSKSRFVFAYTNADVNQLNADLRAVRLARGELPGPASRFTTKHGAANFSAGDRIQITGTDKERGLFNGTAGTITAIDGSTLAFRLDGRDSHEIEFDTRAFQDFRHGYAGTIYKGQGRTLDQTYLYHSEHWRSASSYVALTRHREKTELFVATNTAADLKTLSRQMARVDDRRAASAFYQQGGIQPVRPVTSQDLQPIELSARRVAGAATAQDRGLIASDPNAQQRGTAEAVRDTPRQRPRRDRADIGRNVAPPAMPAAPPVSNDQENRRAEAPRPRRRDRVDIARDTAPVPAAPSQDVAPALTGKSAVDGWSDRPGLVAQQHAAQVTVRRLDRAKARRDRAEVGRPEQPPLTVRKPVNVVIDATPVQEVVRTAPTPTPHQPAPAPIPTAQVTLVPPARVKTRRDRAEVRRPDQAAPAIERAAGQLTMPQAAPVPVRTAEAPPKPRMSIRADSSPHPVPAPAAPQAAPVPVRTAEAPPKPRMNVRADSTPHPVQAPAAPQPRQTLAGSAATPIAAEARPPRPDRTSGQEAISIPTTLPAAAREVTTKPRVSIRAEAQPSMPPASAEVRQPTPREERNARDRAVADQVAKDLHDRQNPPSLTLPAKSAPKAEWDAFYKKHFPGMKPSHVAAAIEWEFGGQRVPKSASRNAAETRKDDDREWTPEVAARLVDEAFKDQQRDNTAKPGHSQGRGGRSRGRPRSR